MLSGQSNVPWKNIQLKAVCLFTSFCRCWEDTSVNSSSEAAITSIALRGAGHQVSQVKMNYNLTFTEI